VVRSEAITRSSFHLPLPTATHRPIDPDLAQVIEAWPTLPPAIREAILAMLRAAE
jgi:hypothetical protein